MAPLKAEDKCFIHSKRMSKERAASRSKAGASTKASAPTKLDKAMDAAMTQFGYDMFVVLSEYLGHK